jgi:hypothetical protein
MQYRVNITGRYASDNADVTGIQQILRSLFERFTGEDVVVFNSSSPPPKKSYTGPPGEHRRYPNRMRGMNA